MFRICQVWQMLPQYNQVFIRDLPHFLTLLLGTQDQALSAYMHQEHRRAWADTCGVTLDQLKCQTQPKKSLSGAWESPGWAWGSWAPLQGDQQEGLQTGLFRLLGSFCQMEEPASPQNSM